MSQAHAAAVPFLLCLLAGGALAAQETELAQQALGRVEKAVMQAAKARASDCAFGSILL